MSVKPQFEQEVAGLLLVIAVGAAAIIVTAVLSPIVPWLSGAWVFVVLTVAVLGTTVLLQLPKEEDQSTDTRQPADGGVIGVDLLHWANERVGTECLGCEHEITYLPVETAGGHRMHRIECGCTVIESTPKEQ